MATYLGVEQRSHAVVDVSITAPLEQAGHREHALLLQLLACQCAFAGAALYNATHNLHELVGHQLHLIIRARSLHQLCHRIQRLQNTHSKRTGVSTGLLPPLGIATHGRLRT